MALVSSNMLPLGQTMPSFRLDDTVSRTEFDSQTLDTAPAVVIAFICNHCPYVSHLCDGFTTFAEDMLARGVAVVAINANSEKTHPMDGPPHMHKLAKDLGWQFPYCFDETQEVAKAFDAACTPDWYVFDGSKTLIYRGQFDDSRPGNDRPVTGQDVRAAVEAVLTGQAVSQEQTPSIGCNIKWNVS